MPWTGLRVCERDVRFTLALDLVIRNRVDCRGYKLVRLITYEKTTDAAESKRNNGKKERARGTREGTTNDDSRTRNRLEERVA